MIPSPHLDNRGPQFREPALAHQQRCPSPQPSLWAMGTHSPWDDTALLVHAQGAQDPRSLDQMVLGLPTESTQASSQSQWLWQKIWDRLGTFLLGSLINAIQTVNYIYSFIQLIWKGYPQWCQHCCRLCRFSRQWKNTILTLTQLLPVRRQT